jgi:uncharacterized membrane protein
MQQQATSTFIRRAIRWLVPAAAALIFAGWLFVTPPGLFGKADAIGYAVCHRIDVRSFHLGARQLPLCARCTGTFSGAAVGLIFLTMIGSKRGGMPPWKIAIPLLLFVAAWVIDGSNSYLYLIKQLYPGALPQLPNLYIPNNTLRLLTGSGIGLAISAALYPTFNQTVWKRFDPQPALSDWRQLGALIGLMLLIDLGILSESPLVLYPVALIGVLGVLALLTMIFTMVWVMIMRQDNSFERLRDTWLPWTAGFTMAMILILAIDLFRLHLTGTWGGFPLG